MKLFAPSLFFATASLTFAALNPAVTVVGEKPDAAGVDYFERFIRPVLAQKCYGCHSKESGKQKGGLLLDTREGIRMGGDSGHAVVPGDPSESLLLKAIRYEDKEMEMPPKKEGGKLPEETIAKFDQWIRMGAPDPRGGGSLAQALQSAPKKILDMKTAKEFWAFQLPRAHQPPAVKDTAWARTDVDRFILAAQEAAKLKPAPDADRTTLIRRVYFDLIGLPPRPDEVAAFVKDKSPDAFAKVVDRLLAAPQFGERWGRHWLDVARYAESTGKERNFTFPAAYRYRDYVIASLNADQPYDQFIREQIAGDLLPSSNDAERNRKLIATGFLAIGPKGLNEKNREQFKMDLVDEQIDVTTRAITGVTVACARCHDHKFDPIAQRDYYAMAGIFRSTETYYGTGSFGGKNRNAAPLLPLANSAKTSAESAIPASPAATPAPASPLPPSREAITSVRLAQLAAGNPRITARLAQMTPEQKEKALHKLRASGKAPETASAPATAPAVAEAQAAGKKKKKGKGYAAIEPQADGPGQDLCMGVMDGQRRDTRILVRGELDQPTETVPRGFVNVLTNGDAPAIPATDSGRLQLADWLTAPTNPLTARVAVNRIWLHLFGAGLVRTADNFGATGEKPSHPELLDTLAVQFTRDGWSVKKMIRSLVLSHTYQLSAAHDSFANETDPDNHLLWHTAQRRLDAEAIRDAMLAASGQLDSVPPTGSVVSAVGDGYIGKGIRPEIFSGYEGKKRSVYLPVVRDFVPEALEVFDFAEPSLVVASRDTTNVPSQALYMMNNDFVRAQAGAMATRILATSLDYPARLNLAYHLALGRPATEAERKRADQYLLNEARAIIPLKNGDKNAASLLAWSTFCQALFASAEFRYLN